ncbi:MAG: ATP-binding protein [Gemmatimonadaceae bacterium]
MTTSVESELSARLLLANALRQHKNEIVKRWLERINARVAIAANKVFPSDELLNHVPILIEGIADFLERPDLQLDTSVPVTAKAMELGELRHSQGFDVYQILKEHELLSNIILSLLRPIARNAEIDSGDLLVCWQQIGQAIELIRQATVTHFLRLAAAKVSEREDRLRLFNRMVSHELKSRIGAIGGAAKMLEEDWIDDAQRARFQQMIVENSDGLKRILANLESLSRLEVDTRQQRNILLPQAAAEAVRQLRDLAQSKNVEVVVAENLPPVEVDAAAVEVCLVNLISNAIKYSDGSRNDSRVEISGTLKYGSQDFGELVVRVRDNGIGIPPHARARLFQQFYRAHEGTVTEAEGTGLGLSIVRETAESLGGSAWAEFPEDGGTVFAFSFPSRRTDDAAAAGIRRPEISVTDMPGEAAPT